MKTQIKIIFLFTILLMGMPAGVYAQAERSIGAAITTSAQKLYEKQTFDLTLMIQYTGIDVGRHLELKNITDNPSFSMISEFSNLPVKRSGNVTIQTFRCQARVTEPGFIRLAPTLEIGIIQKTRAFIGFTRTEVIQKLTVSPTTIEVLPLPVAGRPDSFSGAVGTFNFSVILNSTDVAVGDLIRSRTIIDGTGYFDKIKPPRFSPGRHFKVYDPKLMPGSSRDKLIIEQTLVPMSTNAVALPEIDFTYFDPEAKRYRTLKSGPFPLKYHEQTATEYQHFRPQQPDAAVTNGTATTNSASTLPVSDEDKGLSHMIATFKKSLNEYPVAVLKIDQKARLVPAGSALSTFEIPVRSSVTVLKLADNWAKIEYGRKRGWIPTSSLSLQTK